MSTPDQGPQCPPVPHDLTVQWMSDAPHAGDAGLLRELYLINRAADWGFTQGLAAALAVDGPAVPEGREPASVTGNPTDADLELRMQRLESMRETEKAALLDAFRQIDRLKKRMDFHYTKLCRLEEVTP